MRECKSLFLNCWSLPEFVNYWFQRSHLFCNSDYQAFEELEVLKFHGICEKRAWISLCGVALQTVDVTKNTVNMTIDNKQAWSVKFQTCRNVLTHERKV